MKGQVIGTSMFHGYAGSYSRQPDMVIDTHLLEGEEAAVFGAALVYGASGVKPFGADSEAADFVGVASREVKSATDYFNQNVGQYHPGEAVSVFKMGCINVICQKGVPSLGGKVYVRIAVNEAYPNAVIGGFEAAEDTGKTVELTNAQWRGTSDGNGVAEMRILTMVNA